MGLIKKFWKKTKKAVTKPITKVFKGVARGIAKVGKAVMRGVSKISKKFGPLGMIAMAVAMPYAMSGLSSMIGYQAGTPFASGLLARTPGTFLRAVGNIGAQIRNGYQIGSGALGKGIGKISQFTGNIGSTITDTIAKTFQKFGGGGGGGTGVKDNWWTRISKGAKNLFNSAKSVVTGQPTSGSVDVTGISARGPASWSNEFMTQSMTNVQAQAALEAGTIHGGQLTGQSFYGSTADKLVAETINKAAEKQISQLSPNAMRHYTDVNNAYKANNTYINNQQALDTVLESQGTSYQGITDFDGLYNSDLGMTGDYKLINPNEPTSYSFTGDRTFDNPVAKKYNYKKHIKRAKKATLGWAKDSLLAVQQDDIIQPDQGDFLPTQGAEFAGSIGASLSATDIKGATGSSDYANVFGTAAWEKLRAYHKHMNYQGST